jgi:hypothetical protein
MIPPSTGRRAGQLGQRLRARLQNFDLKIGKSWKKESEGIDMVVF